MARLGVIRSNALQSRTTQEPEADAARVRSIAAYKDFLTLWKDADPDILVLREAKAEYALIGQPAREKHYPSKYPPAEPEALRLLAPQRGLIATGEKQKHPQQQQRY